MTAADFQFAIEGFVSRLGEPAADILIPGKSVARPAGRPFKSSYKSIDNARRKILIFGENSPKGRAAKRSIAKGEAWRRLGEYRERVRFMADRYYGRPPLEGPLFAYMIFNRQRPKADKGTSRLVTTRPDGKNLRFALEDALNPRPGWRGLWKDDSQVDALVVRRMADEPGARIIVWAVNHQP